MLPVGCVLEPFILTLLNCCSHEVLSRGHQGMPELQSSQDTLTPLFDSCAMCLGVEVPDEEYGKLLVTQNRTEDSALDDSNGCLDATVLLDLDLQLKA